MTQVPKFPNFQISKYPTSQRGLLIILYMYLHTSGYTNKKFLTPCLEKMDDEKVLIIFKFDFFFQPFLGGGEFTNAITGKIKLVKEVLVTLDGHWDDTVMMKDKKTGVSLFIF